MGQGTETTLAQVAAHHLEIDMADVRVVWGDTDQTPYTALGRQAAAPMSRRWR